MPNKRYLRIPGCPINTNGDSKLATSTRDKIREDYSKSGAQYDQVRMEDPRGVILSDHDTWLFDRMFPTDLSGVSLFEIGAGTGRFTIPALERGASLLAADINQTMLDELDKKVSAMGAADRCETRIEDIFKLSPGDGAYDYVLSLHVIPRFLTLEDQRAAIAEVGRVIKPGGKFFFNYRNSKSFYNLWYKGHAASPEEIEKALADAGMRVVDKRGKWLLNRKLVNKLPLFAGKLIAFVDRLLERFWPNRAWDVFLIARKD
jgi:ubiquinone/menaquinone biosynthesis C-methylase UbiE